MGRPCPAGRLRRAPVAKRNSKRADRAERAFSPPSGLLRSAHVPGTATGKTYQVAPFYKGNQILSTGYDNLSIT